MTEKSPPVCPECGSNQCLLDGEVFARVHLKGADKEFYDVRKRLLDRFLALRMIEHHIKIERELRRQKCQ